MLAWIYDVLFLALFAFAAVLSWRKGFLAGLMELIGAVLGVGVAVWASRALAPAVYTQFLSGSVTEKVQAAVAQSGGDLAAAVQALHILRVGDLPVGDVPVDVQALPLLFGNLLVHGHPRIVYRPHGRLRGGHEELRQVDVGPRLREHPADAVAPVGKRTGIIQDEVVNAVHIPVGEHLGHQPLGCVLQGGDVHHRQVPSACGLIHPCAYARCHGCPAGLDLLQMIVEEPLPLPVVYLRALREQPVRQDGLVVPV